MSPADICLACVALCLVLALYVSHCLWRWSRLLKRAEASLKRAAGFRRQFLTMTDEEVFSAMLAENRRLVAELGYVTTGEDGGPYRSAPTTPRPAAEGDE